MDNEQKSPELPRATVSHDGSGQGRGKPYRRRWSNYLLNKSLQLRYVVFVTALSAALSGSLGYLIWQQESLASSRILESLCEDSMSRECAELKAELGADLSQRDTNLVLRMGGMGVALVLVLMLYLVIMTHKVAGPLYKVSMYFDRMAEGRLGDVYPLRRGDMLTDFYDKFQAMHEEVRGRHQRDNELVGRFLQACEDAGVSREGDLGASLDDLETHHRARARALS